ncbi:MAG TPA: hypothetical protein VG820_06730, partial [Fimbriimonadaceae bacterium]|nr:hypothetical protein [Fimbriimonadaceae bacterium]
PLTGNFFAQGITHSIHSLNLTGTSFDIDVSGPWPDTCIAGFQIVETPEPAAFLILAAGFVAATLKQRHIRSK